MSLDKSLKSGSALTRHRNVLSRAERIETLADEEKWEDGDSVFGLLKVAHRKVQARKSKPVAAAAEAALEGAEAAPGAEGAPAEGALADEASKADDAKQ